MQDLTPFPRADPILEKYLLEGEEAQSKEGKGLYSSERLSLYGYGKNNPVTYKDPDGNRYIKVDLTASATLLRILKNGKIDGQATRSVGIAISFPQGRDDDAMYDIGITASATDQAGVVSKKNEKTKASDTYRMEIGAESKTGDVVGLEGVSESTTVKLGVVSLTQDESGKIKGGKIGKTGVGVSKEESSTNVYSLRRGINNAINATVDAVSDAVSKKVDAILEKATRILPEIE